MTEPIPPIVQAIAAKFGREPMEWKIYEDRVVVVFKNGMKTVVQREPEPTPAKKTETPPAIKTKSHAGKKK